MYFQPRLSSSVVRYKTHNQKVPGSILTGGKIFFSFFLCSAISALLLQTGRPVGSQRTETDWFSIRLRRVGE